MGGGRTSSLRLAFLTVVATAAFLALGDASAHAAVTRNFESQITEAGGAPLAGPRGLAVDGSGNLYVADSGAGALDKYDASGAPVGGWGTAGKLTEVNSTGLVSPFGVTVDSSNSVWLTDTGLGAAYKLSPTGAFEKQGEGPEAGGAFPESGAYAMSTAYSSAAARLFIADSSFDQLFLLDDEGAFKETFTGPWGTGCCFILTAADNSAGEAGGDIYVSNNQGAIYRIDTETGIEDPFSASGEPGTSYIEGAKLTGTADGPFGIEVGLLGALALAVDSEGNLFVGDRAGHRVDEFAPSGRYLGKLTGTPTGPGGTFEAFGGITGLGVGAASGKLYVADLEHARVDVFAPPVTVPDVTTQPSTEVGQTPVLHGTVDPAGGGPITDCHFVVSGGIGNVPCDQPTPITAAEDVTATATGLSPNTDYTYRLVAANADGANEGAVESFRTTGPPLIESLSASDVSATAANLEATINPEGTATSYHFDYITEDDWLADSEAFGAGTTPTPVPDQPIGSGNAGVELAARLSGLAPHTSYRYRVVASSIQGSESEEAAFTTQAAPNPLLPDGRGYELVSPVDKLGSTVLPISEEGLIQSAPDGSAITYLTNGPVEPQPESNNRQPQILSLRGVSGWSSKEIAIPHQVPIGAATGSGQEYQFFTGDLSSALLKPAGPFPTPGSVSSLSPDASEQTPYVRRNVSGGSFCAPRSESCYRPLVTGAPGVANVPPGTVFGEANGFNPLAFLGATGDLGHVILRSNVALTNTPLTGEPGLYEWNAKASPAEQLQLVSVLPGVGETAASGGLYLGSGRDSGGSARGAVGPGGQRVFWESSNAASNAHIYVRDLTLGRTVQLDAVQGGSGEEAETPRFQVADAAADRVLFTDRQRLRPGSGGGGATLAEDLYECHLVETGGELTCDLTDLTPLGPGGEEAEVQGAVLGISEDAGAVYFVARGILSGPEANEHGEVAISGQPNLYVREGGQTKLIAVLSPDDSPTWGKLPGGSLRDLTARVSADGRYLAFQSQRPLTGYDNRDVASGGRDEEVFLYDNQAGKLTCASCNPSGARPLGSESQSRLQRAVTLRTWAAGTGLAAVIPGWTSYQLGQSLYQSRYLSNSGRLFFNSFDALAPEDSNGTADVYQYEPAGVGGCSSADHGFVAASNACIDLISSGTSPEESGFLDASESGDDVFFLTSSALTGKDKDQIGDVYDARVGGGETAAARPVQCEGDGCQQPAVPPNDSTPGSLTFQGAGNVLQCPKGKVKKGGKCVKQKAKRHKSKHKKKAHKRHAKSKRGAGR